MAEAGRQTGAIYLLTLNNPEAAPSDAISYLGVRLGAAVGHGGTFDYQRQGNSITGFTQFRQFRDVADVNVGLFAQQAGLTLKETLTIAGTFARLKPSNARPDQPHGLEPRPAQFIATGFNLGLRGVFDQPATP